MNQPANDPARAAPVLRRPAGDWAVPATVLLAAVLACGPLLFGRGYALIGDMSFVPHQPWKPEWLGLDGSAPRAVPADAIVSVLSRVIPADLLQKAILLGALLAAGLGAARLARELGASGRTGPAAAGVLYLWNPYVHERLAIGHWGLLVGYAALPWVAVVAGRLRRGDPAGWARLLLVMAPAALGSPTGGLLAAAVAVVVACGSWRRVIGVLAVAVVLNLPWLVPGVTGAEASTDPAGVEAFAARADSPFGLLGSLLSLGGIWKSSIVPGARDSWFLVLIALAASVAALVLLIRMRRGRLVALAAIGLLLAAVPAIGPGTDLVRALVEHVPGAGLLRDSQKWLALLALPVAAGFGLVVPAVSGAARRAGLPSRPFALVLVALPVVVLPSMAWGLTGDLEPVRYPSEWQQVRAALQARPAEDRRTVVLPFSAYQRFTWNDDRAALDPALRFLPGQVVANDLLTVSGERSVAGDSADAAAIGAAIEAGTPLRGVLASAGVRFVLVERTAAGAAKVVAPSGTVVHDGPELRLIDLGTEARIERARHRTLIVIADLATLTGLVLSGSFLALRRIARRSGEIG